MSAISSPSTKAASHGVRGRGEARRAEERIDGYLREAARIYDLPLGLLRALVKVESNYHVRARSRAGAMGLTQMLGKTARSMGVRDPYNERQSVLGGARYLRVLANRWNGDLVLTIASYNAGPGAVARYGGIPPYRETQRYVRRVLMYYLRYRDTRAATLHSSSSSSAK